MSNFSQAKIIKDIKAQCIANITLSQEEATRFFKVSEGSYGAGDEFLGVTVPALRKILKIYKDVKLQVIEVLLKSKYNEERLLALLILVNQYKRGDSDCQKKIFQFYFNNLAQVNNWNLVDSSAHHILGDYLWDKDKSMLNELAVSGILWERRIAIVATWYFIGKSELDWTFKIAKLLRNDTHDLIHKAVGWMLREAGKKDKVQLISFLFCHGHQMPKTMLRYAMEKLSQREKADVRARIIQIPSSKHLTYKG